MKFSLVKGEIKGDIIVQYKKFKKKNVSKSEDGKLNVNNIMLMYQGHLLQINFILWLILLKRNFLSLLKKKLKLKKFIWVFVV